MLKSVTGMGSKGFLRRPLLLLLLLNLLMISIASEESCGDSSINLRPIIGILTQEPPEDLLELLPDKNYTSFIDACYVKFVESAGARVVPIFINQNNAYYENIASSVNGILFPGGDVSITNSSGYGAAGQKLYELAVKAYDEGIHLPVWGTCLGQEMILYLAANQTDWMTSCLAENKADSLTLQPDHEESLLFREMPKRIKHFLQFENTTVNFHEFCSTPENFTASGLIGDFRMLATSFDYSDLEYVAVVEHREMPIFASQFHPEMTPFQWPADGRHNNIPHSSEAIQVSHFFADFFVSQARFNDQHFQTLEEEREALIYNYQSTFTGYEGMIYTEVYLFR